MVSEALGYDRWADAEQATPHIVALRARLRAALDVELNRSLRAGSGTSATRPQRAGQDDRSFESPRAPRPHVTAASSRRRPQRGGASLEQLAGALAELFELSEAEALADDAEMSNDEELLTEQESSAEQAAADAGLEVRKGRQHSEAS